MHRGSVVSVSLPGAYGKPRPALVIQSNLLSELDSIIICPITSEIREAAFRVLVEPDTTNGLHTQSQVMVDKISTLPKVRVGPVFGRLDRATIQAVERALLVVTGIA
ncbi:type II toxin-antitoxin system PemK/MazF family toxin [uncultured Castellaniella sp.]|uniref:type II toxin-antitoxin system PemK/MazF family toxin n=1 Tax=uncultured Castellaniella sp. TaxID=647907 RepID=UPI00262E22C9|nr:type II toxin-antitoxin system PemK/MazF family toxin [uncultured Castellaniella sp.]